MRLFKKFSKWSIKYVGWISLVIAVTGLFKTILWISLGSQAYFDLYLNYLLPFNFFFLNESWFDFGVVFQEEMKRFYISEFFFEIVLIIGSIIYLKTKGKEKKLLYVFYSILFIVYVFGFAELLLETFFASDLKAMYPSLYENHTDSDYSIYKIYFNLFSIVIFLMIYYVLKHWSKDGKTVDIENDLINSELNLNKPNSLNLKLKRIAHLVLDFIILFFTIISIMNLSLNLISHSLNLSKQFDKIGITIFLFLFMIIYHTVFEYLFNITPAKIITHSKLISINNEALTFKKIFKRSLARHIPFNSISFLFTDGWHDKLTNTTVVNVKEKTNYKVFYWVLLILFITITIANIKLNPFYYG